MSAAQRLIAAAAISPEIEAWISLQLKAGRKPSEILDLPNSPLQCAAPLPKQ